MSDYIKIGTIIKNMTQKIDDEDKPAYAVESVNLSEQKRLLEEEKQNYLNEFSDKVNEFDLKLEELNKKLEQKNNAVLKGEIKSQVECEVYSTDYENTVVVKPGGTPNSAEDIIQTLTLQAAQGLGVVFSLSFDQMTEAKEKLKQALEDAKEKIENVLNNTNSVQTQSVQSAATTQSVVKKTNITFD